MHTCNVVIDHTKVSADLTDYVVYVNLADLPSSFWSVVANGGGDIRVFKSDGTTELAREVVSCDTATDTGELHIKFSGTLSSSSDTTIQIHADGTSSEPAVTATYGRNAVWSDYFTVLHFQSGATDSTGNVTWTANGTPAYNATNTVLGTVTANLDGTDDYYSATLDLGALWTIQSLCYYDDLPNSSTKVTWAYGVDSGGRRAALATYWNVDSDQEFGIYNGTSYKTLDQDRATGSWKWYACIQGSTTDYFYVDGSLPSGNSHSGRAVNIDNDEFFIARAPSSFGIGSNHLDAKIDEFRIRESELASTWLSTEYNNQSDPSTFYTAEAVGSTGTNTQINIGDTFRDVTEYKLNVGGVWKDVTEVKVNVGDTWRSVF